MEENNIDKKEELEKTDNIAENLKDEDNITREINLDELYDGAINNTVIIDPVSKDEILELNKKSNKTLIIIVLIVIVLLALYYVNNNFDINIFNNKKENKAQVTTTTTITTTKKIEENGTLVCEFNAKSDSDSTNITYTANYVDSIIKSSEFNYVLISNLDSVSEESTKLQSEYESYFISNASVIGNNITFEKTDKGFNFNDKIDYATVDFNSITVEEGKMNYFVKPNFGDTYLNLKETYEKKGFSCKLTSMGANLNEKTTESNN